MTQTILKYSVGRPEAYAKNIELPIGAQVLSAGIQHYDNDIFIWCLVDPSQRKEQRSFVVVGTGWNVNGYVIDYIGRVTETPYEWHILEVDSE